MKPDGEVITVAGWRVQAGHGSDLARPSRQRRAPEHGAARHLAERPVSDNSGFRTPLDVAIDPTNERIWYVAGYEDQCIWKVEILDSTFNDVRVSVFAGSPSHTRRASPTAPAGGALQRPGSLVFDPVRDVLYVADQDNDAIRRISPRRHGHDAGRTPGMGARRCRPPA